MKTYPYTNVFTRVMNDRTPTLLISFIIPAKEVIWAGLSPLLQEQLKSPSKSFKRPFFYTTRTYFLLYSMSTYAGRPTHHEVFNHMGKSKKNKKKTGM